MNAIPGSYPTTSDISGFMREIGYEWSNDVQTYYNGYYETISDKQARRLYKFFIGDNPYEKQMKPDIIEPTH